MDNKFFEYLKNYFRDKAVDFFAKEIPLEIVAEVEAKPEEVLLKLVDKGNFQVFKHLAQLVRATGQVEEGLAGTLAKYEGLRDTTLQSLSQGYDLTSVYFRLVEHLDYNAPVTIEQMGAAAGKVAKLIDETNLLRAAAATDVEKYGKLVSAARAEKEKKEDDAINRLEELEREERDLLRQLEAEAEKKTSGVENRHAEIENEYLKLKEEMDKISHELDTAFRGALRKLGRSGSEDERNLKAAKREFDRHNNRVKALESVRDQLHKLGGELQERQGAIDEFKESKRQLEENKQRYLRILKGEDRNWRARLRGGPRGPGSGGGRAGGAGGIGGGYGLDAFGAGAVTEEFAIAAIVEIISIIFDAAVAEEVLKLLLLALAAGTAAILIKKFAEAILAYFAGNKEPLETLVGKRKGQQPADPKKPGNKKPKPKRPEPRKSDPQQSKQETALPKPDLPLPEGNDFGDPYFQFNRLGIEEEEEFSSPGANSGPTRVPPNDVVPPDEEVWVNNDGLPAGREGFSRDAATERGQQGYQIHLIFEDAPPGLRPQINAKTSNTSVVTSIRYAPPKSRRT